MKRVAIALLFAAVSCGTPSAPPDGGVDASSGDVVAYTGPKRIFVTHDQFPARLGLVIAAPTGLQSADAICNKAAQDAHLGGTFKAWLSDSTTDAIDRIADVGPWYFVDGVTKVFENKANLMTTPLVAIDVTETGAPLLGPGTPWTGTELGGRKSTQANDRCSDWTSTSATAGGLRGSTGATDSQWTAEASAFCDASNGLFCIEQ